MNYSEALHELKAGRKLARKGWNGKGLSVAIQFPDLGSKMTQPYTYIVTPNDDPAKPPFSMVPWIPSQTDQLAEDWVDVE